MTSLSLCHDFRPLPFLGNAHVQTVLGAFWTGPALDGPSRERHIRLDDGDRLAVQLNSPRGWRPDRPTAILVHGLGGSHRSGYMQRTARLLLGRGVRVARLDLRGCGSGLKLARRSYNAGCSADVRAVTAELHREAPRSPLLLIGYSLGGNIVLKFAGESATNTVPGLACVAAVAPPIDLELCSEAIAQPRNRIYDQHFVRDLVALARRRRRCLPGLPAVRFPRRMSLWQFDDMYTAPQGGFAGALDYYRRSSSLPLIPRIAVPTLILTARDDPFIPAEPFELLKTPAHITVRIESRGGHLGFVGWDGAGGIRWAERYVVEWVISMLGPFARPAG